MRFTVTSRAEMFDEEFAANVSCAAGSLVIL